jgi:hypothetical protein
MHPLNLLSGFFVLAVTVGALTMFLAHPTKANALFASGASVISGTTEALEGRKVTA